MVWMVSFCNDFYEMVLECIYVFLDCGFGCVEFFSYFGLCSCGVQIWLEFGLVMVFGLVFFVGVVVDVVFVIGVGLGF